LRVGGIVVMGAFVVAGVAALGNLLQGWDGGAIAGACNSNPCKSGTIQV